MNLRILRVQSSRKYYLRILPDKRILPDFPARKKYYQNTTKRKKYMEYMEQKHNFPKYCGNNGTNGIKGIKATIKMRGQGYKLEED